MKVSGVSGDPREANNSGWTIDTYAAHNEALRLAEEKFQVERDRRYTEVKNAGEKALKIKEQADRDALALAREIQTYKDEKANELREQINNERGNYATKEVQRVVRRGLAQAISGSVKAVAALNKKYWDLSEAIHAIENKLNPGQMSQMLNAAGTLGLGGGTYAYTHDPEKAMAVMAGKYALKSAAGGTTAAQLARGLGSEVAQRVGGRAAAAGVSKATQKRKGK